MLISIAASWIWRPILPPLQIGALGVLLIGLTCFTYLRTFRAHPFASLVLCVMRLVTVAAMLVLLGGPSHVPQLMESERKPKLTVMLDVSESMLTQDCQGEARVNQARRGWLNRSFLNRLSVDSDIQLIGFADELRALSVADVTEPTRPLADGRTTRLAECVSMALARQPQDGDSTLLLISDGHDTEDASIRPAAALARSRGIPVHTVGIGGATIQRDVTLLAVPMQEYLLPGEPGSLLVKAYQFGMPEASTTVRLRYGDVEREFPIDFRQRKVVELQLEIKHDEIGQYEYDVSIDPIASETETSNNQQVVFCEVQRRRMKVLILEGQPYWDTKFLAQSLRKDERIELTQITQISPDNRETIVTRVEGNAAELPISSDQWGAYDVVILGRGMRHLLDQNAAQQLQEFVIEGGGNVVFACGRSYDPETPGGAAIESSLSRLEPVVWDEAVLTEVGLSLTASGSTSNWLDGSKLGLDAADAFRQLSGFESLREVQRIKPSALVLAEASDSDGSYPALTTMQAGRGRVVSILGQGSWRWSLLAPNVQEFAQFYDIFWSNLVRWMVVGGDFRPGEQVSMRLSRQSARLGDEMTVDVVFKQPITSDLPWRMEMVVPDGSRREVACSRLPGGIPRFRATLSPETVGVHQLVLRVPGGNPAQIDRSFNVYDINVERLETSARVVPLQVLAEHSGGRFLAWDRPEEFLQLLHRQRVAVAIPPEAEYVWDQLPLMVLILVWSGLEWLFRRLAGLL